MAALASTSRQVVIGTHQGARSTGTRQSGLIVATDTVPFHHLNSIFPTWHTLALVPPSPPAWIHSENLQDRSQQPVHLSYNPQASITPRLFSRMVHLREDDSIFPGTTMFALKTTVLHRDTSQHPISFQCFLAKLSLAKSENAFKIAAVSSSAMKQAKVQGSAKFRETKTLMDPEGEHRDRRRGRSMKSAGW